MFRSLKLTSFRKHEDLTLNFEGGLIAIRGLNEAGKTTIQEALAYALFGTKGLRQSLSEVVTWGKPESSLQVELFLNDGRLIRRGKRGAEVCTNSGVIVTGQTEVTRVMETMLGASADTAARLMLASQNALRGALEGGPGEAVALIEKLADFDLIDRVVAAIVEDLPTGNTQVIEEQLAAKQAETVPEEEDTKPLAGMVEEFNWKLGQAYERQKALSRDLQTLDIAGARRFMQELQGLGDSRTSLQAQIEVMRQQANVEVPTPSVSQEQIGTWREAMAGLQQRAVAQRTWESFRKIESPQEVWAGTEEDFIAEFHVKAKRLQQLQTEGSKARYAAEATLLRKISEKQCAFCGKDLSEVPEVIRRNAEIDAEYQQHHQRALALVDEELRLQAEYDELVAFNKTTQDYERMMSRFSAFTVRRTDRQYPAEISWKGEPPSFEPVPDYSSMIAAAEKEHAAYQRALGTRDSAANVLAELESKLVQTQARFDGAMQMYDAVDDRIRSATRLEHEIEHLTGQITNAKLDLQHARNQLELAEQRNAHVRERKEALDRDIELLEGKLKEQRFNNALLKRVRQARPAIADKLWTTVLAAVSHHFSIIRGTQSVITRSDNGFKCDGQAVQGLSGSTLDALGLAIRIALTKTFLPNSRFMLLDEPGAAADAERESNMLGLLAACDFEQVLLVTHSDLADSFATQVIRL